MINTNIAVEAEFTLLRGQLGSVKRRQGRRFRSPIASLGKLLFPETGQIQDAWIKNISKGGVGLNLGLPLESGREVVLVLKSVDNKSTFRFSSWVKHSTQEIDGTWRIGCQFANELTEEELDALL